MFCTRLTTEYHSVSGARSSGEPVSVARANKYTKRTERAYFYSERIVYENARFGYISSVEARIRRAFCAHCIISP